MSCHTRGEEMSHLLHKLTAKEVKEAKGRDKPYRINDGGGLYLLVKPNKLKSTHAIALTQIWIARRFRKWT